MHADLRATLSAVREKIEMVDDVVELFAAERDDT